MAENETEQLSSKFFNILKDTDLTKNANIQTSSDNLANSIININKELNSETATAYLNEIEKINKEIPDFKEKKLAQMLTVIKDTLPSIQNPDVKEILDIPLIEYLAEKQSKEYNQEKENFEKRGKVVPKAVSDLIRDRRVANVQEFKKEADKSEGVSGGYIADEKATGKTFMLKQFYKKGADVETTQQWMDRNDAVRELIGGNMYEQLLYNRAPKEELVTGYANSKLPDFVSKILYVRSKFLENSEHLGDVLEQTKTPKLSGFEKAIAASHILGESDYHTQNLMVQNNNTVVKIDHGRSFMNFNKDFTSMLQDANEKFERFGYNENIEKGQLTFNVKEYSKSLNQMLNQLDNNQIDNIIDQKVDELVKNGFDAKGICPGKLDIKGLDTSVIFNNEQELRKYYKDNIKENLANMKEIAKKVDIVAKYSNPSPDFENGKWLKDMANSPMQDPVAYAAHNDIQIEGKNALQWAHENNYKIEIPTSEVKTEKVTESQWSKNANGKWEETPIEVEKKQKEYRSIDPLKYILSRNQVAISKSEKEFLNQAINLGIKNNFDESYKENTRFKDDSIVKNLNKEDKTITNEIEKLAQKFVKNNSKNTITTEAMEKLYDDTLQIMKDKKLLTDQDIVTIKNDKSFKERIKNTTEFINNENKFDISKTDKVYYKLARFCKKVGFKGIANDLKAKIDPETLNKINKFENVQNITSDIREVLMNNRSGKEGIQTARLNKMNIKLDIQPKLNTKPKNRKQESTQR